MVDIETAVANAKQFALTSLGPERTEGIRLEEVESSHVDGMPVWLITLSSLLTGDGMFASVRGLTNALGADPAREYKTFTVTKDTGEVLSMKIRMLATPAAF